MVNEEGAERRRDGSSDDLGLEVLAEIRRLVVDELGTAPSVAPDDTLAGDLRVDSVGALVLAVGLEDRFRVELDDAEAEEVLTVADLVGLVVRRVHATRGAEGRGPDSRGLGR